MDYKRWAINIEKNLSNSNSHPNPQLSTAYSPNTKGQEFIWGRLKDIGQTVA